MSWGGSEKNRWFQHRTLTFCSLMRNAQNFCLLEKNKCKIKNNEKKNAASQKDEGETTI